MALAVVERDPGMVLEDRGAELMGVINAATAGLVAVIADALATNGWSGWGIHTPEHWVGLRFGLSRARARRLVAAARALADLPQVRAAFDAGELSEDHIAEIARAQVSSRYDGQVAQLARVATIAQLRHALRWLPPPEPVPVEPDADEPRADEPDAKEPEPETGPEPERGPGPGAGSRCAAWWGYGDDGTWDLHVTADVADGAMLEKALAAAADALFRGRYGDDADPMLRQRITNLDAVLHVAATGLDTLARDTDPARRPRERWLINLHVHRHGGTAHLHLGPPVTAATRDERCCDALVRRWDIDPAGTVNLGRIHRVVNPRLRAVIEHRDGGCRVPGCEQTRWLIIHHIRYWTDGGPTDTHNLLALCPAHHRAAHRGELTIAGNADGELVIADGRGRPLGPAPPRPPNGSPHQAATQLGLPQPAWHNRAGEPAHWDMLVWTETQPARMRRTIVPGEGRSRSAGAGLFVDHDAVRREQRKADRHHLRGVDRRTTQRGCPA